MNKMNDAWSSCFCDIYSAKFGVAAVSLAIGLYNCAIIFIFRFLKILNYVGLLSLGGSDERIFVIGDLHLFCFQHF